MTGTHERALLTAAEVFAGPFYAEPGRAYHTGAHVRALLDALEGRGVWTPALALAAWGHDLIYDPRAADNEVRSADVFGDWLGTQGASGELQAEVRALILATRHTVPVHTGAEALFVDADLSVLGADPEAFDAYDRAIRVEYAHVPGGAYRAGRAAVLRGFLNRERLYLTPEFAKLEGQARVNLARALARLS
ncbi:phosphohydrolase [Deinococcus xianganensis]|uniref:HD domain-containing protein n=1 Tax=Deinococcus xianganensis TaxID=1507289 RepID=UPI00301B7BB6